MSGLDRARLARLLSMLGSRYDGEVVTAGRMAHQLVCAAGLAWPEVLEARLQRADVQHYDITTIAAECIAGAAGLTAWERNFVRDLGGFSNPSEQQLKILERILAKVRRARRQAA